MVAAGFSLRLVRNLKVAATFKISKILHLIYMKIISPAILCLIISSPSTLVMAQALPDLKNQAEWTEKEKQDFLKFLKSGQQVNITGEVKEVSHGKKGRQRLRKARYFTLNVIGDSLIIKSDDGKVDTEPMTIGGKVLIGGHLFSWVRYYGGLKYSKFSQDKIDGTKAKLSHFEIPAGIEFALIPLGTPHTRYVLMRAGFSYHNISGSAKESDFKTSMLGRHTAWNIGLGYEWQFSNSNWRFHVLTEACRSFSGNDTPEFYGLGFTTGLAYTF